ncbi:MAG: type II secretion system protein GspG [Pseudomonadota bacterium]
MRPILVALGAVVVFLLVAVATAPRMHGGNSWVHLPVMELEGLVALFAIETGRLPTEAEGLNALIEKPGRDAGNWNGPYLRRKSVPVDIWGTPYIYRLATLTEQGFAIYSAGPNRVDDRGAEDDVISRVATETCYVFCTHRSLQHHMSVVSLVLASGAFVAFFYLVTAFCIRKWLKQFH